MASIPVRTPTGEYEITIERGLLQRLNAVDLGRCAIVTNRTIAPLYGEWLVRQMHNAVLITISDGEQHKTLDTVSMLYSVFVRNGLDRTSTVIALGGGVVGDTAGFAAATYMRGVNLVQIPTSLLAMVDSSVGGKVGVDLPQGKNLVGAFKQPDAVLIDPDVLKTLPDRERACGMAEVVKHGFLADPSLLESLDDETMIARAVQVKVNIVEQDPYEQNIRAYLNLGHTFAHAIEQVSGYEWLHGEAVGVGLVAAARLSAALGLWDDDGLVQRVVERVGLPTHIGNLDPESIYAAMATDKKWQGGHSRFILLEGIGQPTIVKDVPVEPVIEVLDSLRGERP